MGKHHADLWSEPPVLCPACWAAAIYYFFFHFLNYIIVMQLLLSAFSRHLSTPPQPNPPPSPASTLPLGFVHVSFIVIPENPSPHCPFSPPFWLSLDFS